MNDWLKRLISNLVPPILGALAPARDGLLTLEGLEGPVEILTDRHGRPHVYAGCLHDLYLAQGYLHGRERLWQMELNRRAGKGRLSEVFGPGTLVADRFMRRLGLYRLAADQAQFLFAQANSSQPDSMGEWVGKVALAELVAYLQCYVRGVNQAARQFRPLELRLLGIPFEPFTVSDCLLWTKMMSFDMSSNWEAELLRAQMIREMGPDIAHEFHLNTLPLEGKVTSSPVDQPPAIEDLLKEYQKASKWLNLGLGQYPGSNAWAISGRLSASGKALLSSDPHLALRMPSVWYPIHLHCPLPNGSDMDIQGVSMPGMIGVLIGRTRHTAWGCTNSYVDCQDIYIENFALDEEPAYLDEVIRIKGQADEVERVEFGKQGPLIGHRKPSEDQQSSIGLSLRWTGYDYRKDTSLQGILELNFANSIAEMEQAIRGWFSPCMNIVAADDHGAEGNIAYWLAGAVPRRRKGIGLSPVPADDPDYDWDGYLDFDEKPKVINPDCGFVVSANQAIVDERFPHVLTLDWMGGFRALRIKEVLKTSNSWTPEDFRKLQLDTYCQPGHRFARMVSRKLEASSGTLTPLELAAWKEICNWQGDLTVETVGGCIYQVWLLHFCRRALVPVMGESCFKGWMGGPGNPMANLGQFGGRFTGCIIEALEQSSPWLLSSGIPLDELLLLSLKDATAELVHRLGEKTQDWQWGKLHTVRIDHPLGVVDGLGPLLNAPARPYPGDADTVCQSVVIPHQPYETRCWSPSFRMVVELGGDSSSVMTSGASGWPGDPHYLSHFESWIKGDLLPDMFWRHQLEVTMPQRLYATPA
jgi:penicillin G amidase